MANLNNRFAYSLEGKTYRPKNNDEIRLIYNKLVDKSFWKKKGAQYVDYKKALKKKHYFGQNRRCAYCRTKLRTDAYWEDLDHVVAQDLKGRWIFYPKNLIVTCSPCNRLKNADPTLTNVNARYFPLRSNGFSIFNPHFDKWEDNFVVENGIFLKGIPGTKGPATYKYCQLYRYDIIIEYSELQRIWSVFTMRRLTHRLKHVKKGSYEEISAQNAIDHLIQRKKNNQ